MYFVNPTRKIVCALQRKIRRSHFRMLFVGFFLVGVSRFASNVQAVQYTITDLGTLDGYTGSQATAINDAGQITGDVYTSSGSYTAFLYSSGTMTSLGSLGGSSIGYSINKYGQVAGVSYLSGNSNTNGFIDSGGTMTGIAPLSGLFASLTDGRSPRFCAAKPGCFLANCPTLALPPEYQERG